MRNRTLGVGMLVVAAIAAFGLVRARLATLSASVARPTGLARPSRVAPQPTATRSAATEDPIETLSGLIEERFRTIDEDFGGTRIPTVHRQVQWFDPKTPEEKATVAELQQRGWTVGLYLGGRDLLTKLTSRAEWDATNKYDRRREIGEPILIAGDKVPSDLPEPWDLREIGRNALVASSTSDRYETTVGRWSIDVRPVRATRKACLGCHAAGDVTYSRTGRTSSLKVGDALGVLVYAYRRTRD